MKTEYKISLFKNPRYLLFILLSLVIFCINLFLYHTLGNFLFLIISILAIFTASYFIMVINNKLNHCVFFDDDHIAFQKTKSNIDVYYFRNITLLGYYKKKMENGKFIFGDGLYLYDEKKDNYILIGTGFTNYNDLYKKIKDKSNQYNLKWIDIKRDKNTTLVEELQKLLNQI